MSEKKTVFLSGATGVMGKATLDQLLANGNFKLRLLVRYSTKNLKLLRPYIENHKADVEIIWGDLLDYGDVERAIGDVSVVIHLGGLVSPVADRFPQKTMKVNVGGTENVVKAIQKRSDRDKVRLIYIGSVAQMSLRNEPVHWGRAGDPLVAAKFDHYGLSKIRAERIVAESGLKMWVSLRQTGILHPGLFTRGTDPITFHVPLRGVLEWATLEDSARLMEGLCGDKVPDSFWRNFYNIGSGEPYRLTNYEFERMILKAVGSPAPEKIFESDWFATRNFHGCWFLDSDRLEELVPFRANISVDKYFRDMVRKAPLWVRLAPLAPAFLVKKMMKKVALTKDNGTLYWKNNPGFDDKIKAFFGSLEEWESVPGWEEIDLNKPSGSPRILSHGYDESKPEETLTLEDCRKAAEFRGGKCLSEEMKPGDLNTTLEWQCAFDHKFTASPATVLKGGHWCPECLSESWNHEQEAAVNPFLAQVILPE